MARPFVVTGVSTYRMVVALADPAHAAATAAGGQSGHPASPNYRVQSDLWAADAYHPLLMDRDDVEANLEGLLTLEPGVEQGSRGESFTITLPETLPDEIATVIALELDRPASDIEVIERELY